MAMAMVGGSVTDRFKVSPVRDVVASGLEMLCVSVGRDGRPASSTNDWFPCKSE